MNSRFNWDNLSSFLKDKWSLHQSQCFRSLDLKKDGWGMGLNYYTKGITNEVAIRIFEYLELILCKEVKALQYCDVRSPTEMMLMFEWRRAIENHSLKSGFHVAQQVPRYYYDHLKQRARIRKIDFLFSYSSTKYLIPIQLAVECDSSYNIYYRECNPIPSFEDSILISFIRCSLSPFFLYNSLYPLAIPRLKTSVKYANALSDFSSLKLYQFENISNNPD